MLRLDSCNRSTREAVRKAPCASSKNETKLCGCSTREMVIAFTGLICNLRTREKPLEFIYVFFLKANLRETASGMNPPRTGPCFECCNDVQIRVVGLVPPTGRATPGPLQSAYRRVGESENRGFHVGDARLGGVKIQHDAQWRPITHF